MKTIWERTNSVDDKGTTRVRRVAVMSNKDIVFDATIVSKRARVIACAFVATPAEMIEISAALMKESASALRTDASLLGRWRMADGVVIAVLDVHNGVARVKTASHKSEDWTRDDVVTMIDKPGTAWVGRA